MLDRRIFYAAVGETVLEPRLRRAAVCKGLGSPPGGRIAAP